MKQSIGAYFAFSICTLMGLASGIIGIKLWVDRQQFIKEGIEVMSTVIDVTRSSPENENSTLAPVVSYITQVGDTLVYRSNIFNPINPPEIGDQIKLWYDPSNPRRVELGKQKSGLILVLLLIFLVFGSIGFFSLLRLIRSRIPSKY